MIVIIAVLLGLVWGVMSARRRKGNLKDIAQYAAAHAIAFGLAGVILTLIVHRMAL
jgi:F0F1-type ATP synthase assembly protein I